MYGNLMSEKEILITNDIVQEILSILGNAQVDNEKLNRTIRRATSRILNYLNDSDETSETIKEKYFDAVVDFSIYLLNKKDNDGIKQYTEGGQSITYSNESNYLPESIKSLLPSPCIRIGGY